MILIVYRPKLGRAHNGCWRRGNRQGLLWRVAGALRQLGRPTPSRRHTKRTFTLGTLALAGILELEDAATACMTQEGSDFSTMQPSTRVRMVRTSNKTLVPHPPTHPPPSLSHAASGLGRRDGQNAGCTVGATGGLTILRAAAEADGSVFFGNRAVASVTRSEGQRRQIQPQ